MATGKMNEGLAFAFYSVMKLRHMDFSSLRSHSLCAEDRSQMSPSRKPCAIRRMDPAKYLLASMMLVVVASIAGANEAKTDASDKLTEGWRKEFRAAEGGDKYSLW